MTDTPFFSLLLPTRNRSAVIGRAIESVLNQSFGDYELVISDNDEDRSATKNRVATYSDPRIRYDQTARSLSMPDNWQSALIRSRGKYITVLQDKQILFPDALSSIYAALRDNGSPDVLTWKSTKSFEFDGVEFTFAEQGAGGVWLEESRVIVDEYTRFGSAHVWPRLPRMINSCVSRSFLAGLGSVGEARRFFVDISPDLSASFIQLALASKVGHLDKVLVIATSQSHSGGLAIRKRTPTGTEFVGSIREERKACGFVSVQNPNIVSNLIVDDFRNIRNEFGGILESFDFSDIQYARELVFDLAKNMADGIVHADRIYDTLGFVRRLNFQDQARLTWAFFSILARRILGRAKGRVRRRYLRGKTGALVRIDDLLSSD